ncbi:hypothetical protein [Burkholderia cepacia]|uniref:hypothetical protein n=1 Tax=Burkholderia cepacia TaxID=292 RepID=UPI001F2E46C9|nr:hypothetical protein [Burkholderia cepacia]UIY58142.1 hypothetical protein LZ568_07980 [Burkholderia cepacia]
MNETERMGWLKSDRLIYALQHYGWRKGEEQFCNRFSAQFSAGPGCTEDELRGYVDLAHAAPDMAEVLEMLAADADAGEILMTSGVRLAIDAALIKAGRKAAPEPVRVVTIAGVDR